ncbi:hypothetical protein RYX36_034576 [Vicia faba]
MEECWLQRHGGCRRWRHGGSMLLTAVAGGCDGDEQIGGSVPELQSVAVMVTTANRFAARSVPAVVLIDEGNCEQDAGSIGWVWVVVVCGNGGGKWVFGVWG